MNQTFLKIYSIISWGLMLITSTIITPFFLIAWLLTFWWDRRRIVTHMMATFWAWHFQFLIPFWKLRIEGREKIPWNRPVVLVANHRSLVDILALHKIRRPFKWVSKKENFKLPFVGWVLLLNNCIAVNRENIRSGMQFITQAKIEMRKGSSIMIFPEGTRSKNGKLRSFKEGAFLLAKRMESGIIPIVHTGTDKTFNKGKASWILKGKANIQIKVLDEIPPDKVSSMGIKELSIYVRDIMEKAINKMEESETTNSK